MDHDLNDSSNKLREVTLPVEGMSCASCVLTIEKSLQKVDGVTAAAVNLALQTAEVKFDQQKAGINDLINTINSAGYDVPPSRPD